MSRAVRAASGRAPARRSAGWLFFLLGMMALGCGSETFGTIDPEGKANPVWIASILEEPEGYEGRRVTVRGSIESECASGCWLRARDETGTIYVELNGSGLEPLPQREGSGVVVTGVVRTRQGRAEIFAAGVEIE